MTAARVRQLAPAFFGELDQAVADARASGVDVIDVSKGNPDLPTPPHIVHAMQRAVADPANHSYPSFAARPALADAIARRYREDHGVDLDPDAQIAVFHGAHEGLMAAVLGLVDPATTVILPGPGYPAYDSAAQLAGAAVHRLPLRCEHDFQPDFTALTPLREAALLMLNYPHNPTGAVATVQTFETAAAESRRLGAAFVHDFAYSALSFDGPAPSALAADLTHTVEISTLSKTYNMAGWRLGFAAGATQLISAMRTYQAHAFSVVFGAVQDAAAAALEGDQTAVAELVEVYRRRRDLVVEALQVQGWDVSTPPGGFFVWAHVGDDIAFADALLREHGIAVAPGSGFGESGRGFVRIGLVQPEARLREMIERMGRSRALPRP